MSTRNEIRTEEAFINGDEGELDVSTEAYEGKVALHLNDPYAPAQDISPIASAYLDPIDAALLAERILAGARLAAKDPSYTP